MTLRGHSYVRSSIAQVLFVASLVSFPWTIALSQALPQRGDQSGAPGRRCVGISGEQRGARPELDEAWRAIGAESAAYLVRDSTAMPFVSAYSQGVAWRPLNAWAVLSDWRRDTSVTIAGRCLVRDYWRLALQRVGSCGVEWLYLDEKTHLPVALAREDSHYLWGQVDVEYVYQTWLLESGVLHPGGVARLVDGLTDIDRWRLRFTSHRATAPRFRCFRRRQP